MNKRFQWEFCIEIIQDKISSNQVILHGIYFHLNQIKLKEIKQAKISKRPLKISPSLLADLQNSLIFDQQGSLKSGLTFCTYYQENNSEKALLRSLIFLDGSIINQVCHDCLYSGEFALEITAAHHWLIEQILLLLFPRKKIKNFDWLLWGLSLVLILVIFSLIPINIMNIVGTIFLVFLFHWLWQSWLFADNQL